MSEELLAARGCRTGEEWKGSVTTLGGSSVSVKDGAVSRCKAGTKILAPRMKEGCSLREGYTSPLSPLLTGRLQGPGISLCPPLKGGFGR